MKQWSTLKKLIWLYAAKLKGGASVIIETITGNLPLVLQNAIQHSIKSLTRYGLCTQDGTPTLADPVDIMTNNGALKYGWQDVITTSQLSGYGTYVSPAQAAGNRAYRWFKDLPNGTYTFSVDGDYEIIVQWRDPADPADGLAQGYENLTGWITSGVVTLDKASGGYGIAVKRTNGTSSITPANFDGTLHVQEKGIYTDGTPEVLTVSENLYNPDNRIDNYYLEAGGKPHITTGSSYSGPIPVVIGKRYKFIGVSGKDGSNNKRIVAYSTTGVSSGTKVGDSITVPVDGIDVPYSVTIDLSDAQYANARYIRFSFNTDDTDVACIEVGSGQTASVPMLLSVGDYKDEVEIISGGVTRKVGIKVFDGTETVNVSSAGNAYIAIDGVAIGAPNTPIDTHFALETSTTSLAEGRARFGAKGQTIYSSNYYMSHPTARTAADFKAWLASEYANGTPVIVLYPLATETTEHTTAQNLNTVEGTNIVDSVANVGPLTAECVYMKAIDATSPIVGTGKAGYMKI